MLNHVCELCIQGISFSTCTLANISPVNKQTDQTADFMHWAYNAVDRCWEQSCDWSVAVGVSAFRQELSAGAQERRSWRGDRRVCAETTSVSPRGIIHPPPGSRDALHLRQYADPIGVYPVSWFLKETRLSCRFVYYAEKKQLIKISTPRL